MYKHDNIGRGECEVSPLPKPFIVTDSIDRATKSLRTQVSILDGGKRPVPHPGPSASVPTGQGTEIVTGISPSTWCRHSNHCLSAFVNHWTELLRKYTAIITIYRALSHTRFI